MGYNREDYIRIKAEYSDKYLRARERAEQRRFELYERISGVREIDAILAGTGSEIMKIIVSGRSGADEGIAKLRERNEGLLAKRAELLAAAGYPVDYSDVKYECGKCSDSGFVDGRMCECMKKQLVLAGYQSSGLGGLIRTQSFDNFSLDYYKESGAYDVMQTFSAALKRFAEGFDAGTYSNFLLIGGTGLGKTHLSTAVARTVIERGFDVMYVSAIGMIGDFEDKRFGHTDKSVDRYYDADLLIIDDLGTEVTNQFTLSCIYDVINTRINNRRCTFINTNLARKDIEEKYSERITSRLFGEYYPIVFKGTDVRRQKRTK